MQRGTRAIQLEDGITCRRDKNSRYSESNCDENKFII